MKQRGKNNFKYPGVDKIHRRRVHKTIDSAEQKAADSVSRLMRYKFIYNARNRFALFLCNEIR